MGNLSFFPEADNVRGTLALECGPEVPKQARAYLLSMAGTISKVTR